MGKKYFEQILGLHAAPTLVGMKVASLLSFRRSSFDDFDALLASYAPCFRCKGISTFRVVEGTEYVLLLFYREDALKRVMARPEVETVLKKFGYIESESLEERLQHLRARMTLRKTFPHEIGLFLGYPVEDVKGFIENKGHGFRYSGYWKVYANETATRALFDRYTDCTRAFCSQLEEGASFEALIRAS